MIDSGLFLKGYGRCSMPRYHDMQKEDFMKLKYHVPLIGFLASSFIISAFMFVCRGCPPLDQLIGFYVCVAGAVVTYYAGIHTVLKDRS